jgi:hypothetical protein
MNNDPENDAVKAESDSSCSFSDAFQVTLDENENPLNMPSWRKWTAIVVLSAGALCATCLSSVVRLTFMLSIRALFSSIL